MNWPFNVINPVGQPLAAEHQRILCVCVSCVPADERVAGLIPQGLSASGWLLLIWTTMTHTPILRRLCVCVCVRVSPDPGSIMFFFCFGCILLSSFTSRVRVFLAEVVSLPVFSLDTVAASYPRMHFTLPQRLNGGASFFPPGTAGQSARTPAAAEFRASTFTLRINQIDPVNRIRADWFSVNRHNLRAWARVSVLQVQCDRY